MGCLRGGACVKVCPRCGSPMDEAYVFCGLCGAALPAIRVPPPGAPMAAPYPGPFPRSDPTVLIVILCATLLVLLPIVALLLSAGQIYDGPQIRPQVVLWPAVISPGEAVISVASSQPVLGASDFRLNLGVGSAVGTPQPVPPSGTSVGFNVSGLFLLVRWEDSGGDGQLSPGDSFAISYGPYTRCTAGTTVLYLLWSDGAMLTSLSFYWD